VVIVVAELWFEVVGGGRWGRLSPVIEEVGRGGRRLEHRWQASRTDGAAYREEEEGAKCAKRPLANSKVHKMVCIFETRLRANVSDSGLNYLERF
jgi:hypothetical protein